MPLIDNESDDSSADSDSDNEFMLLNHLTA
jgi:hypothetical protein